MQLLRVFKLLLLIFIIFSHNTYAQEQRLSLEFQNIKLPDAIRIIAKFLQFNVIISPRINGYASLHLHNVRPYHALNVLLSTHGLAKWQMGNIMLIATHKEMIKRNQEEQEWQAIKNDSLPLTMKVWQVKYAKVNEIVRLLQNKKASFLSKRGQLFVDSRTNTICIQDDTTHLNVMSQLLKHLDVPVKQIVIEARLINIDHDFERELGINFTVASRHHAKDATRPPQNKEEYKGFYSIAIAKLADSSLLDVRLSALENTGHAELISSPRLFTTNQQTASIEAGEEVPYQEVSEGGGTAVVFKKAVLGMKVTPQLMPGNKVLLQLTINQDRPSSRIVQGVPTISTRQIATTVLANAGQTIVLGGIFEFNNENGEQGLPFISKVPLLGLLFTQQSRRLNKRELLVFVTPKVIT